MNRKATPEQYEFLMKFASRYHAFFSITERKEDFLARILKDHGIHITVRQAQNIMNGALPHRHKK